MVFLKFEQRLAWFSEGLEIFILKIPEHSFFPNTVYVKNSGVTLLDASRMYAVEVEQVATSVNNIDHSFVSRRESRHMDMDHNIWMDHASPDQRATIGEFRSTLEHKSQLTNLLVISRSEYVFVRFYLPELKWTTSPDLIPLSYVSYPDICGSFVWTIWNSVLSSFRFFQRHRREIVFCRIYMQQDLQN